MASSSASPRVLVVVLNWNGADDTLACLESLAAADSPAFDTVVIDNGSRRSVAPAVRERFPGVGCVELPVNLGYAGGNNVGLRCAIASHPSRRSACADGPSLTNLFTRNTAARSTRGPE